MPCGQLIGSTLVNTTLILGVGQSTQMAPRADAKTSETEAVSMLAWANQFNRWRELYKPALKGTCNVPRTLGIQRAWGPTPPGFNHRNTSMGSSPQAPPTLAMMPQLESCALSMWQRAPAQTLALPRPNCPTLVARSGSQPQWMPTRLPTRPSRHQGEFGEANPQTPAIFETITC